MTAPRAQQSCAVRIDQSVDATGCVLVYSHHVRSLKLADDVTAWLKAHGSATESAWMDWTAFPTPPTLETLK
ncbi:hypothetical protein K0B96_15750 [Horticoccus luteus]|uniref:Uncharacterized protein n=1 Tax=Horticoccus luteus TaxID=2862869 RepID=A0A8F9TTG1_9BACT|nr:hypothetical protein [Horticoccus luteus]QYM78736.1 hypothetical protein K0B96_15750 [Horticoccus luteus]